MGDCRGTGSPLELQTANGSEHGGASGDAPSGRASTPAQQLQYPPQTMHNGGVIQPTYCAPVACMGGAKAPLVWLGPPPPPHHAAPPHPPPPPVAKSVQPNGSDLPMNDIPTLRYYFNLGVECMWAAYAPQGHAGPPLPAPPPPQHQKHYSQRDLAQDMQQMSLQSGGNGGNGREHQDHKNKPQDKGQGKGTAQRPLLGPRFKRNNNQDNNSGPQHNQNKGYNNNNNKGPNNRYERRDVRPPEMEPVLAMPYIPYPPPLYPVQYYPVESDPQMMSMMSMNGMSYMGYSEPLEYPPMVPYYPAPVPYHQPPAPNGTQGAVTHKEHQ